ncbi:MAG: YgfZ/GcvT domain-containing protein [Woeseiaceae bacterium]
MCLVVRVGSAHGRSMPDNFGTCMSRVEITTKGDKVSLMADIPYSTILVSGADAFDFLQAQLSNDLRLLDDDDRLLSAWCNPKGRVICLMTVLRNDSDFALVLPSELADGVLSRLTMMRFRAKAEFDLSAATAADLGIEDDVDAWLLKNLRAGRAEIWKAQSEAFTPHMLNLDLLGAVNFDKGCYPGQEIVARTHYRGASRRRTHRFTSAEPVTPGDKVSDGERDIGEVLNAIGTDLLAVIPTDAADLSLSVDGVTLRHNPLEYS